jgi:hypothetical protein
VAEQLREIDGFQSWGEDILEVTMVQWDSYLREDKVARFRDRRWPAAETGSTEGLVKLTS